MLFPVVSSSLDSSSFAMVAITLLWDTTLFVGLLGEVLGETSFFCVKMNDIFLFFVEFFFPLWPSCEYALLSVPFDAKLKKQNRIIDHG